MRANFRTLFVHSIGSLSMAITYLLTPYPLMAQEDYKFYKLPPILDLFSDLKPTGKVAWMPDYAIKPSGQSLNALAFFPDGINLAIGENDGKEAGHIIKYTLTNERVAWKKRPFPPGSVSNSYMAIREIQTSPDGKYVAAIPYFRSNDNDITLAILDASSGNTKRFLRIPSFQPECKGTKNGRTVMLQPWTMHFGNKSKTITVYYRNQYNINYGACKALNDIWLIQWDIGSGQKKWQYQIRTDAVPEFKIPDKACASRFNLDLTADGKEFVVGNCNGQVFVIDAANGRENYQITSFLEVSKRKKLPGTYRIMNLSCHPVDRNLVYAVIGDAGRKSLIARADLSKRKFADQLITAQIDDIAEIRFSPDGRLMGAGYSHLFSWDTNIKMALTALSGYQFQFNPKKQEMVFLSNEDIAFVHPQKSRKIQASRNWQGSGLHTGSHIAFYAKAETGEFQYDLDVNDDRERAYSYEEEYYKGDQFHKSGQLFFRAYQQDRVGISLIGGHNYNSYSELTRKLPDWGRQYATADELGGRVGVNAYQPADIKTDIANPDLEPDPSKQNWDWQQYKIEKDDADEELVYGIDTSRPALVLAALKAGANPNLKSSIGIPYLSMAAIDSKYSLVLVQMMIEHGANVNLSSSIGSTPLMSATYNKQNETMKFLVKKGAQINHQSKDGRSALMLAAKHCFIDQVKLLVDLGANVNLRDNDNENALGLASSNCDYQTRTLPISKILKEAGLTGK